MLAGLALLAASSPAAASTKAAARGAIVDSIGIRLLDVPAATQRDPRARLYILDHVARGSVLHRRIEVSNTTTAAVTVSLYPAAAAIDHGAFTGAAGHTRNELSTWISARPGRIHVAAGGRVTATVSIHVPHDASPGERYGVVWAEVRASPPGRGGITQVSRVGVRVYLSVGPGGPPPSAFAIESLTAERTADGRPAVMARVHNTGGRALDMNGSLELLDGPGGQRAGPYPATLGVTLAIGDTEPVVVALDKRLPAGPWHARLGLRSGLLHERREATITFPGAEKRSWLPFIIGGAALLLLLVTLAIAIARRGRRRRPPVGPDVTGLRPGPGTT